MDLGTTLRDIRRSKNFSQMEAKQKLKISQTYLSQIETNKKSPSDSILSRICKVYKTPLAVIIWQSMEEKDIDKKKHQAYKTIKPAVDNLFKELL
jgi:transcriptional regulator with XRE-family HTH domain